MENNEKNIIMLMHDISKMFHLEMKKRTNEDSKMVTYRPILHMLIHHDGCNQLDVAKFTMLKAPTISITLKNMEFDGLIRKECDKDDKRNVKIFLTEKGKEQNEKMRLLCNNLKDDILAGIDTNEQEEVKIILLKIINNLEALK